MQPIKYLIFILTGYNGLTSDGRLNDVVNVSLMDTSYDNALERAKKLVKKEQWRLSEVIENYYKG